MNILQEVARLMQKHMKEHNRKPEYLKCRFDEMMRVLVAAHDDNPGDYKIWPRWLKHMRAYAEQGDAYEECFIMSHVRDYLDKRTWKVLGMKVSFMTQWDMAAVDGSPHMIVMSGRVMAPKYGPRSRIYHCITEEDNMLEGRVTA